MTGAAILDPLLDPDEPDPAALDNEAGGSAFFLTCDHGGRAIPRRLGRLGLPEPETFRHIAWDIGVAAVGRLLSAQLDAALIVQAIVSGVLVILNFAGAGVQETFQKLLSLAVVLQLVPFIYMFGALVKFALTEPVPKGQYGRTTLFLAGTSGFLTTVLGIALVFFPAQQITSLWSYELWMFGGTLFFIGLAAFFFFVYGRRKVAREIEKGTRLVVPL